MRNTDRGLDNWMIKIDQKTQEATIVAEPPRMNGNVDDQDQPSSYTRQSMEDADPYGRREPMTATSRSTTPMRHTSTPGVTIGAIDNSLSWPWKHPDAVGETWAFCLYAVLTFCSGEAIHLAGYSSLSRLSVSHSPKPPAATSSLF
jgi:hypothetical protein